MKEFRQSPTRQRGAILIIALIMLLLLTVIGLSSMRGTTMEENMAGNMRDRNLSLQASEAALREGEEKVTDMFLKGQLGNLDTANITASYTDFPGTSKLPDYKIVLLGKLRTSLQTGEPVGDEGAVVRIDSNGYGLNTDSGSSTPSTRTQLRSTYLVEQ